MQGNARGTYSSGCSARVMQGNAGEFRGMPRKCMGVYKLPGECREGRECRGMPGECMGVDVYCQGTTKGMQGSGCKVLAE